MHFEFMTLGKIENFSKGSFKRWACWNLKNAFRRRNKGNKSL